MHIRHLKSSNAFTLVELLVVVAIVALLLSTLLPAMTKAKDKARTVICSTNLRQMFIAESSYAAENKDHLMPWGRYAGGSSASGNRGTFGYGQWVGKMLHQIQYQWEVLECPSAVYRTDGGWWRYATSTNYDWHEDGNFIANICHPDRISLIASIGKNGQSGFNEDRGTIWANNKPKFVDIGREGPKILFGDSQGGRLVDEWPNGNVHNYNIGPSFQGGRGSWYRDEYPKRHNDRTGGAFVFTDGHAEFRLTDDVWRESDLFRPEGWPE